MILILACVAAVGKFIVIGEQGEFFFYSLFSCFTLSPSIIPSFSRLYPPLLPLSLPLFPPLSLSHSPLVFPPLPLLFLSPHSLSVTSDSKPNRQASYSHTQCTQ